MIDQIKVKLVNGNEIELYVQRDTFDSGIAQEVMVQDYYQMSKHLKEGDRVLDLGGEIGTFSVLCAELGAGKVVGVEPLAQHIELYKMNTERYGERVELVEGAITNDGRGVKLDTNNSVYDGKRNTGSTSVYGKKGKKIESQRYGDFGEFDVVKFDIEGAEMEVIVDIYENQEKLHLPRVIVMEYHGSDGEKAKRNGEVIATMLRDMEYTVEKDMVEGTTQGRIIAYKA